MLSSSDTARLRRRLVPAPSSPVKAAALGGTPAGIVIVWLLEQLMHVTVPALVAVAIGTLCSSVAAFLPRSGRLQVFILEPDHAEKIEDGS